MDGDCTEQVVSDLVVKIEKDEEVVTRAVFKQAWS